MTIDRSRTTPLSLPSRDGGNRIRELEAELRRLARRQQHHDRETLLARGVSPELIAARGLTPPAARPA